MTFLSSPGDMEHIKLFPFGLQKSYVPPGTEKEKSPIVSGDKSEEDENTFH